MSFYSNTTIHSCHRLKCSPRTIALSAPGSPRASITMANNVGNQVPLKADENMPHSEVYAHMYLPCWTRAHTDIAPP